MAQTLLSVSLVVILAFGARIAHGQVIADEYRIKAAFLQNFPKFVDWPSLQAGGMSPLVIGIVGDDPFGPMLASMLEGANSNGHPFVLLHLHWNDRLSDCHIVFISTSEVGHLQQILAGAPNALTVSDCDSFARRGGIIELKKYGNRIRFDINNDAAHKAGLRISSKLLGLAMNVYDPEHGGAG